MVVVFDIECLGFIRVPVHGEDVQTMPRAKSSSYLALPLASTEYLGGDWKVSRITRRVADELLHRH